MTDEYYMKKALEQAKLAYHLDDVPIGCVIVYNDEIIGRGFNRRNNMKNVLMHAEISAINEACIKMNDWRLEDCTLYVTVEPCPMCAGAIVQSRIKKVIYGTSNKKAGFCGSVMNIMQLDGLNHKVEVEKGLLEAECGELMKNFFAKRRI